MKHASFEDVRATAGTRARPLVLALGDSLTAGHGLQCRASFTSRLQHLLRDSMPAAVVHDAGVSGNTAGAALARLPRVLSALDARPDLAIVELGANDLIHGVPPAKTCSDLSAIVGELRRCGIPVLLATLEPPPFLASFAEAYSTVYASVAQEHGVATHPFFPPGVLGNPAYALADRIHPSATGIELAAINLADAVRSALAG